MQKKKKKKKKKKKEEEEEERRGFYITDHQLSRQCPNRQLDGTAFIKLIRVINHINNKQQQ